ncbi:MAG: energy transducer TonB [candidate division WOR-3 bacterium]
MMNGRFWFPPIGKRSPIVQIASNNLRTAYYITNGLIFLLIFLVFAYVKYQQWQYQQRIKKLGSTTGKKVITLTYAQLGPPPSIAGSEEASAQAASGGARAAAPAVGVPKPVPDEEAISETAPTQAEISGVSLVGSGTGTGVGSGTIIQVEEIPDINAFVPYEVEPKIISQPPLIYPEFARVAEQEGTVYVKALVDLDGSIMRVVVIRSSGSPILDSAAVGWVYDWKMSPALQNQKPVRVWVAKPIHFKLQK